MGVIRVEHGKHLILWKNSVEARFAKNEIDPLISRRYLGLLRYHDSYPLRYQYSVVKGGELEIITASSWSYPDIYI